MSGDIQAVIDEFVPIFKQFAGGRYAVTLGGSHGKGSADRDSDLDFRLFAEELGSLPELWKAIEGPMAAWKAKGITVDGVWPRTVAEIEGTLAQWLDGRTDGDPLVWTVWGYHLPADVYYQRVIEDPFGLIAGWKARLRTYPPRLKQGLLAKHLGSLRYWRQDYHYISKVKRKDAVFLASLTARLVHDLIQVLFAINETYYVGDGGNLGFVSRFPLKPADFIERVERVLYPAPGESMFADQRDGLVALMDDVEGLAGRYAADLDSK